MWLLRFCLRRIDSALKLSVSETEVISVASVFSVSGIVLSDASVVGMSGKQSLKMLLSNGTRALCSPFNFSNSSTSNLWS